MKYYAIDRMAGQSIIRCEQDLLSSEGSKLRLTGEIRCEILFTSMDIKGWHRGVLSCRDTLGIFEITEKEVQFTIDVLVKKLKKKENSEGT